MAEDVKPDPDPTSLTTEQLLREIALAREFLTAEVDHREELTAERFRSVSAQFDEIARRTLEQKQDTKAAVDAALQAAKELVALQTEAADKSFAKSEASFAKQIDALAVLLQKSSETTDEKINDAKSRLDRVEAMRQGGASAYAGLIAAGTFIVAVAAIAVAIITKS